MILEDKGKPISTVWVELFEKDPGTALRLGSALEPRPGIDLEIPENLSVGETAAHILQAAVSGRLNPEDASKLLQAAGNAAQLTRLDELEKRLEQLIEGSK
jgi:hypothetical protein